MQRGVCRKPTCLNVLTASGPLGGRRNIRHLRQRRHTGAGRRRRGAQGLRVRVLGVCGAGRAAGGPQLPGDVRGAGAHGRAAAPLRPAAAARDESAVPRGQAVRAAGRGRDGLPGRAHDPGQGGPAARLGQGQRALRRPPLWYRISGWSGAVDADGETRTERRTNREAHEAWILRY